MTRTVANTLPDLGHYTGTERWFRHPLAPSVTYTEGARYVAEAAGAHWLLDKIATERGLYPGEEFQVWTLTCVGAGATLTVEDGNGRVLGSHVIGFTDFPEPGITLWCVDRVILLPSEY